MDKEKVLELFNKHMRKEATSPGSRREEVGSVIRHVSLSNEPCFVIYSEMNESTADQVIEEQIAYFKQIKMQFEWKVFDYDQPLDLRERLRSRGFTIEETEALMIIDLTESNQLLDTPVKSEIRRVTDEQGIWDIVKLEDEVWGENHHDLGERLITDMFDDTVNLSVYAAYEEGKAVSTAWMYLHQGTPFASLWGGSTLPQFRKMGYYSSLLGVRAQEAAEKGYQFLTVDASPMSRPILEKHGFKRLANSTPCMSPK